MLAIITNFLVRRKKTTTAPHARIAKFLNFCDINFPLMRFLLTFEKIRINKFL